jgi:hypothetical protein
MDNQKKCPICGSELNPPAEFDSIYLIDLCPQGHEFLIRREMPIHSDDEPLWSKWARLRAERAVQVIWNHQKDREPKIV